MGYRRTVVIAVLVLVPIVIAVTLVPALAQTVGAAREAASPTPPEVMKWAFAAAAFVAGASALGAAYAVAVVGGAAMGAVAEKPETAGRALVFVGLAEGIAIYGLIVAIMILGYVK
jgi:V/A-type H+-transporting ATPase subunit K